jgi:hypothetical protein
MEKILPSTPPIGTEPLRFFAVGLLRVTGDGGETPGDGERYQPEILGQHPMILVSSKRAVGDKHVPRYLAEFEYRFNRRYDLAAMMPRLGYVAVRTPPMPFRLLKLAEDHA